MKNLRVFLADSPTCGRARECSRRRTIRQLEGCDSFFLINGRFYLTSFVLEEVKIHKRKIAYSVASSSLATPGPFASLVHTSR